MLFVILLVVLIIAGLVACYLLDEHCHETASTFCCGASIVLFVVLVASLLMIPASRSSDRHLVIQATATQQTINDFRTNGDDLERTGLIEQALEFNVYLAQKQSDYKRNKLWWGLWRDYSVMEIKPIQ